MVLLLGEGRDVGELGRVLPGHLELQRRPADDARGLVGLDAQAGVAGLLELRRRPAVRRPLDDRRLRELDPHDPARLEGVELVGVAPNGHRAGGRVARIARPDRLHQVWQPRRRDRHA